jgi:hypothetical protein
VHRAGQVRGQHVGGERQVIPLVVRDELAEPGPHRGDPARLASAAVVIADRVHIANSARKNATFSAGGEFPRTGPGGASKNPACAGPGGAACCCSRIWAGAIVEVKIAFLNRRPKMKSQREIVFKRCGCTNPGTGRQLAAAARAFPSQGMAAGISPCR